MVFVKEELGYANIPAVTPEFIRASQVIPKKGQLAPLLNFALQSGLGSHLGEGGFSYANWVPPLECVWKLRGGVPIAPPTIDIDPGSVPRRLISRTYSSLLRTGATRASKLSTMQRGLSKNSSPSTPCPRLTRSCTAF